MWKHVKEGYDFTFHDLKAKGITDFEGDKQAFSGHKTCAQMETYNRGIDVVDIVNGESLTESIRKGGK